MIQKIYPENPNPKNIQEVVNVLRKGGVIIYPTDSVYAFGCDINSKSAIEKICRIRGIKPEKANFSFICSDLSHLSDYAKQVSTPVFRVLKKTLPGPYTFILNASNEVPKILKSKKKTIGIRVPDNNIARALVEELGHPIMSASLKDEDDYIEYTTDPELIAERYQEQVDVVIDGGYGNNMATTVVDFTQDHPEILREGLGDTALLF